VLKWRKRRLNAMICLANTGSELAKQSIYLVNINIDPLKLSAGYDMRTAQVWFVPE
jgi:hypothetical protein